MIRKFKELFALFILSKDWRDKMPILRKQKVRKYTTVDNYFIDDINLPPEGKGYLLYMLRKPDNWNFTFKNIQEGLNVGERNVRTNIQRLEDLKYIKRERIRNDKGYYQWIYYIYEIPYDIDLKNDIYPYVRNEHVDGEDIQTDQIYINTINNKDKEDKQYTSSFFNREDHNRLTLELIDLGYIDKEDLQLYYYDEFFEDLINKGNSYRDLITVLNYVVSRVIKRDFIDEECYEIKNKLGYLKNSINSNLNKLNNMPDELYPDDGYDWLNDEEDIEI